MHSQMFYKQFIACLPFTMLSSGLSTLWGFPGGSDGKECACNAGDPVQSLGQEDPLEKGMATDSSILAWKISWTEETGRLHKLNLCFYFNFKCLKCVNIAELMKILFSDGSV